MKVGRTNNWVETSQQKRKLLWDPYTRDVGKGTTIQLKRRRRRKTRRQMERLDRPENKHGGNFKMK